MTKQIYIQAHIHCIKVILRVLVFIFYLIELSSLINSSTCGERVDACTLSRSKQSINDNVISNFPYVISKTVYVANNVHIAVKKSFNGR